MVEPPWADNDEDRVIAALSDDQEIAFRCRKANLGRRNRDVF